MIKSEYMETNVTKQGVIIPKNWLSRVKKLVLRKQTDPILELGSQPVLCGLKDGSNNPDKYIYGK